jgi:hypothetical protein
MILLNLVGRGFFALGVLALSFIKVFFLHNSGSMACI